MSYASAQDVGTFFMAFSHNAPSIWDHIQERHFAHGHCLRKCCRSRMWDFGGKCLSFCHQKWMAQMIWTNKNNQKHWYMNYAWSMTTVDWPYWFSMVKLVISQFNCYEALFGVVTACPKPPSKTEWRTPSPGQPHAACCRRVPQTWSHARPTAEEPLSGRCDVRMQRATKIMQ